MSIDDGRAEVVVSPCRTLVFLLCALSLSPLPSVTLSLEAKLQMLHTYMTVTWLALPCEVKMEAHTHSQSSLFICNTVLPHIRIHLLISVRQPQLLKDEEMLS